MGLSRGFIRLWLILSAVWFAITSVMVWTAPEAAPMCCPSTQIVVRSPARGTGTLNAQEPKLPTPAPNPSFLDRIAAWRIKSWLWQGLMPPGIVLLLSIVVARMVRDLDHPDTRGGIS
jgi:hypothetical protein